MKEHPQADILRAIADGKTVQMRSTKNYDDNEWWEPTDVLGYINSDKHEFRIKPETMSINGHEFPIPVRWPLKEGKEYWIAELEVISMAGQAIWRCDEHDFRWLKRGLIQLTEEGAIAQAKAMIAAIGGEA